MEALITKYYNTWTYLAETDTVWSAVSFGVITKITVAIDSIPF
jgi:hypothetical protein